MPACTQKSPPPLEILYEDNHLLGVNKPAGLLVQGDRTGDPTLLEAAKAYLKEKYNKPGNVFVGLVHRLDRPVSGVVLFARTSKAASRLAAEFRKRQVAKTYLAVVEGRMVEDAGELEGFIKRDHKRSRIVDATAADAREAVLAYRVLATRDGMTLVEVAPRTGRHHQIRLQLADHGYPVAGDLKYGAREPLPDKTIALHAASLEVAHPTKDAAVRIESPPPSGPPWQRFHATIEDRFR